MCASISSEHYPTAFLQLVACLATLVEVKQWKNFHCSSKKLIACYLTDPPITVVSLAEARWKFCVELTEGIWRGGEFSFWFCKVCAPIAAYRAKTVEQRFSLRISRTSRLFSDLPVWSRPSSNPTKLPQELIVLRSLIGEAGGKLWHAALCFCESCYNR